MHTISNQMHITLKSLVQKTWPVSHSYKFAEVRLVMMLAALCRPIIKTHRLQVRSNIGLGLA